MSHAERCPVCQGNEAKFYKADYIDWLMDPIRFPELVAGWLKERRKG